MNWMRFHWMEMTAVTGSSTAAVTVSPWFGLATLAVAGQWLRHEMTNRPTAAPPRHDDDIRVKASQAS